MISDRVAVQAPSCAYSEVENMKKGEVSLKALPILALSASAPNNGRRIVLE